MAEKMADFRRVYDYVVCGLIARI